MAEVLWREMREHNIGVSVLCPMRTATEQLERFQTEPESVSATAQGNLDTMQGRILPVEEVAEATVDAIIGNRLYVLPHIESRAIIQRRFSRIDATYDQQPSTAAAVR
jgi:short-subunit dehydrogenase